MYKQAVSPLAVLAFLWFSSPLEAQTFLHLDSEEGDYIGQGQEIFLDESHGTFSATPIAGYGVTIQFRTEPLSSWWTLHFAAPEADELIPGPYEGATRYPFQSPTKPGLSVSGNGRGAIP